ncbi:sulfotransferase [Pontixanthobacter aquaemixtae]|uniref:Sulfotransferase family protein n=1 Tax=Pontixanthobacter aquaemixtae TaxID=1958940 RepID=A0A844ZSG8_9SPHN|nr:sulfotransferase [Pontixanthobacter aquaemixtae]MXO90813.1 hypothetical protein [Pontixanthobacter aquaemixtae]
MSKELIEKRRQVIKKHLFLLCPNNSGSTYLSRAIGTSRSVWSLDREGQHVVGFAGPSTVETPWPLIWGAADKSLRHFRDSPEYDWDRTKRAWYFHASAKRENAPVFLTKSPPFLLIPDQLAANFMDVSFLFMVRNPYAMLEGIVRRWGRSGSETIRQKLPRIAAKHIVTCLTAQRANIREYTANSIAFTYETLCAQPDDVAKRITGLVPELDDLDLTQKIAVKGTYNEPLRNMNDDAISRLKPEQIAMANEIFRPNAELLSHFDYRLIET